MPERKSIFKYNRKRFKLFRQLVRFRFSKRLFFEIVKSMVTVSIKMTLYGGSEFLSYEDDLRKMTSSFELLTQNCL